VTHAVSAVQGSGVLGGPLAHWSSFKDGFGAGRYVGVGPGVGVGVGAGVGCGAATVVNALLTLMRPNDRPATGSVAPRIWADAALLLLPLAMRSAARPAVSAADAEVPVRFA